MLSPDTFSTKYTVLIADNNADSRQRLTEILAPYYTLLFARSRGDLLPIMHTNRERLTLVLLALEDSAENIRKLQQKLREDPYLFRVPTLVISSAPELESESLDAGAIDFIRKPLPPAPVVLARVRRCISLTEERKLIGSSAFDTLTGLYNPDYFYHKVAEHDLAHASQQMDAVLVDVQRFHLINERYGKEKADGLLRRIAVKLLELGKRRRGLVCRRDSDTFLFYCPHTAAHQENLDWLSAALMEGEGIDFPVFLRMGVYEKVDKNLEIERRFDHAQSAANLMRGSLMRSVGYYDSTLHEKELFDTQLVDEFYDAIRDKQFFAYYQPKFDIRPDVPRLVGAEALVRWQHPRLGLISPSIYVPIFEENGLIKELDRYMWREVAKQIRDWKERLGFTIPISVNVSRVDVCDPDIMDTFRSILNDYQLNAGELQIEITESVYTQNSSQIISTVNLLREHGFQIEMDDFGSGYSSLNMLSSMPVDALKLDMKFIQDAFRDGRDMRLIEVIIEIAEYLNVPIIAEGVETREQLLALKALGCQQVQGYYFSKPVPAEKFEPFLLEIINQKKTPSNADSHTILAEKEKAPRRQYALPPVPHENFLPMLQWLTEQIPGGFFIYRADGSEKLLFINQELILLYGCSTREELLALKGDSLRGFVHPDDYLKVLDAISATSEGNVDSNSDSVEYRILRKDGSIRWLRAYFHYAEAPGYGQISYVFVGDITEKRRIQEAAQQRLHAYENTLTRHEALSDNSLAVIRANLSVGVVGEVRGTDPYETDYIGSSIQSCLEERAASLASEEDRERFLSIFTREALLERYSRGETHFAFTALSRRASGKQCIVRYSATVSTEPVHGDKILFMSETESNFEPILDVLKEKVLALQFELIFYIIGGRYGLVLDNSQAGHPSAFLPKGKEGLYADYLRESVIPLASESAHSKEALEAALGLNSISKRLQKSSSYVFELTCAAEGKTFLKHFSYYTVDSESGFYLLLVSDVPDLG